MNDDGPQWLASLLLVLSVSLLLGTAGVDAAASPLRTTAAREYVVPRTVLALYDSTVEQPRTSRIHLRLEFPLNHLGLTVRHVDVRAELPDPEQLSDVRGVLSWFTAPAIDDADTYVAWTRTLLDRGVRLVVFDHPGIEGDRAQREFWSLLQLRPAGAPVFITYDLDVLHADPDVIGFEQGLDGPLPDYLPMQPTRSSMRSLLTLEADGNPDTTGTVVAVGTKGGYVADNFGLAEGPSGSVRWRIDPFEFFRRAYGTDDLPKPDVTTLVGRRIFYSHIDGDGWRNVSEISPYRERGAPCAEVVLHEVLERFDDLPVTVGAVAADIDPGWYGSAKALDLARRIYALTHVEAGSHSYSHPLDWSALQDPDGKHRLPHRMSGLQAPGLEQGSAEASRPDTVYDRPRSYELRPSSLDNEIDGSVEFLRSLLPEGKRVELFQWSGNTSPYPEAIAATRRLGLRNINGGDTRFDALFPSYASVAPVGIQVGDQWQVFSSTCNEMPYTQLWTSNFYGFAHLRDTLENTGSPRRVKPVHIYYHMYSGEKPSSLRAVQEHLEWARGKALVRIAASRFASIADGFNSTRLIALDDERWLVEQRDGLDTLRFDDSADRSIDWARSRGVLGQRREGDVLYVALDRQERAPLVALASVDRTAGTRPFLIESSWEVFGLEIGPDRFTFSTRGFGRGELVWQVPPGARYEAHAHENRGVGRPVDAGTTPGGQLRIALDATTAETVVVDVRRIAS